MAVPPLALIIQGVNDVNVTRYFSAAGMVMMLYDHLLTISDEYRYIWKSRTSFAKWAFLFNRYFVPTVFFVLMSEMCGFNGTRYSDYGCRLFLTITSLLAIVSVAIANALVLLRVIMLWMDNRVIKWILSCAYVLSLCTVFSLMVVTCVQFWHGVRWSPVVNMCIITTKTRTLGVMWGVPMFFEITVIGMVAYNSISVPRSAQVPLSRALHRDGITFFLLVMFLRMFNAIIATVARPTLATFGVYFVWGGITTALNRSLLRLRKVELKQLRASSPSLSMGRAISPFGLASEVGIAGLASTPISKKYTGHLRSL